jgi:hypothetical protein
VSKTDTAECSAFKLTDRAKDSESSAQMEIVHKRIVAYLTEQTCRKTAQTPEGCTTSCRVTCDVTRGMFVYSRVPSSHSQLERLDAAAGFAAVEPTYMWGRYLATLRSPLRRPRVSCYATLGFG